MINYTENTEYSYGEKAQKRFDQIIDHIILFVPFVYIYITKVRTDKAC